MRKGLAASAVVAGVVLAGCSGGSAETPPSGAGGDSSAMPTPTSETGPQRTAPAKSLELADKCSIVAEQQWRALGGNQVPLARESNGKQGCQYQSGEAGTDAGWTLFIAVDSDRTMQEFADLGSGGMKTTVAGYPVFQAVQGSGCLTAVDISDNGSLFLNSLSRTGTPDPCELSKKFAKAAVENLPNEGA